jgi:hypothetical protein
LVEILGPMVENLKILGCFHMECPYFNFRIFELSMECPSPI